MSEITWWLSFALDDGKTAFCCLVDAPSFREAFEKACRLGLNAGGEVLGFPIPEGEDEKKLPRNRHLTPEELEIAGCKRLGDVDGSN